MHNEQDALYNYVIKLFERGMDRQQIMTHLLENGHDQKFAEQLLAGAIQLRDAKRRHQGLIYVLFGAFVCLASCVLTFMSSSIQGHFPYVLYGLTSLGILIVFAGFMKVF